MYRFPNPDNNPWIEKYNKLIEDIETGKLVFNKDYLNIKTEDYPTREQYRLAKLKLGNLTKHHIIPKKVNPALEKDKNNLIYLPFKEHMDLHYYLWKADKQYAPHLLFGFNYGKKYNLWNPLTPEEESQLKEDCREYRKNHTNKKNTQNNSE